MLLRVFLRARSSRVVSGDESVEPAPLFRAQPRAKFPLRRTERAVRGWCGCRGFRWLRWRCDDICRSRGARCVRDGRLLFRDVCGEGFESAGILEQLAEGDFDAELPADRDRGLREEQRVEAEFEESCVGRTCREIHSGKIGEQMLELIEQRGVVCNGRRGVVQVRGIFNDEIRACWGADVLDRPDACPTLTAGTAVPLLPRCLAVGGGGGDRRGRASGQIGEAALALEWIAGERDAAAGFASVQA